MQRQRTDFVFHVISNKYDRDELQELFEHILSDVLGSSEVEMGVEDPKGYWVKEGLYIDSIYTEMK
jgi:hypothetical protein